MPDWLQVILQTLGVVIVLFFLMKILGKRQISQLSLYEYVTGITIGSLAGYVPLEMEKWHLGLLSLIVWVLIIIGVEYLQLRGKRLRDWLDGKQTVLIKDGKLLDENFKKERLTIDELLVELRKRDVYKLADIEIATMEPNGTINVLVKKEHRPLTAKMLGLNVGQEKDPQLVIVDGTIRDDGLSRQGLSREWLYLELEKQGIALENVFVAQVDSDGQLFVDVYDDQMQIPVPQEKERLFALLKKCAADLETFALSTKDSSAKQMYTQCATQLNQAIDELKPHLVS